MATEKIPREYSNVVFERIISALLRRIESLESAKTIKKLGSLTSDAAPLLEIGEPGYTRDDNNNLSFVIKADDGKLYRFTGQLATSTSTVGTPAGVFVLKSGDTMTGLLILSGDPSAALGAATKQYADTKVADTGDTMTGALVIDGSADAIQLRIQGNATQTNNIFEVEDSAAANKLTVANNGKVFVAGEIEIDGALNHDGTNVGFFGVAPTTQPAALTQTYATADRTLSAYTSDGEGSAYTGIDNAQAGTVYAQVSDLNALRTAYENLRVFTEDAVAFLNALIDDMQLNGLEQ